MPGRATQSDHSESSDSDNGENDETAVGMNSSDSQGESDNSDSSDNDDSLDGTNAGGLLDLEAADSDLEHESEGSEESFDEDAYALDGRAYHPRDRRNFPQFMKLPIELRMRIWENFCPDLNGARRVIDIRLVDQGYDGFTWYPTEGRTLRKLTETSRAVLAVHQESRNMALTWFPDTLPLCDPSGQVRFNRKRDIVKIDAGIFHDVENLPIGELPFQAEFCAKIINIAVPAIPVEEDSDLEDPADDDSSESSAPRMKRYGLQLGFLGSFTNLQNVFGVITYVDTSSRAFAWLETSHCHWTKVDGIDATTYSCWHDPDTPCNREGPCAALESSKFCELLTIDDYVDAEGTFDVPDLISLPSSRPIYKWPFLQIDQPFPQMDSTGTRPPYMGIEKPWPFAPDTSGLNFTEAASIWEKTPDAWDDDSADNIYESDGIDDSPIDDPQTEDEDMGSGIEDDTLAMELLSRDCIQDDSDSEDDSSDSDVVETEPFGLSHAAPPNGFSPPEESSDSDDSAPRSPSKRQNARRIVLDDSDEEEEGEGGAAIPADASATGTRGIKRRRIISDDEDEDDEDDGARPQKRHHRASSSETEGSPQQSANSTRKTGRPTVISSDSDSEPAAKSRQKQRAGVIEDDSDEEEEESEDDAPPKALSLAERLKIHRQANPVSSASEEDSDDEEDSGLRYGEGESESEEEENSMLDDMAEDGTDGEEDEDDGY